MASSVSFDSTTSESPSPCEIGPGLAQPLKCVSWFTSWMIPASGEGWRAIAPPQQEEGGRDIKKMQRSIL